MSAPTVSARPDQWRRLGRVTGACGLAGVVLLFTPIIAISSLGEPAFDASPDEVTDFFQAAGEASWYQAGEALVAIGMLALLWFFVGTALLLRRIEGEPPWRATVALLSGVLLVAYGLVDASWDAAGNRGGTTDPAVATYAFDVGNLGFANTWLALASLSLATGWVLLETRALPAWCGWWAVVAGAGFVVARFAWESSLWMAPYALFWVGAIAVAIRLLRRGGLGTADAGALPSGQSLPPQGDHDARGHERVE